MNADSLVDQLDRLDHRERLATLIDHGRRLARAEAEALCRALLRGDVYRRRLALQLAQLRGLASLIDEALDDSSLSVRCFAAALYGRHAEAIPVTVLDRLDTQTLAVVLRAVVRRRRAAIAEALVEGLLARERLVEAASLLTVCRPEQIGKWLDGVAWPESLWLRLAKHRSTLLIARIEALFHRGAPELVWRRFGAAVWAQLAQRRPAAMAAWIDRHADAETLPANLGLALRHLVCWSPAWVATMLAGRIAWVARFGVPKGLPARLRLVDDDRLIPLCRGLARTAPAVLGQLIARLPYPRRAVAFEAAIESLEIARIEWPTSLLAVLPTAIRDREAARMLGLVRAQTDANWRRELLGLREVEIAWPELERDGRSAQASDRAGAYMALIRSAARSRTGMGKTLAWLGERLRNEQDPVRLSVLAALAQVPGHRFDDPVALDRVIAPIFDARDTSFASRGWAAKIAHRLLIARATEPSSPMFGLGLSILERLAGQAGTLDLPRLDRNLPRGAELAIVDALLTWVRAAQRRQQEQHVFRLWSALGKRAWRVPALELLLVEMLWNGRRDSAASTVQLWLQDPRTRDQRVRELVARDRSALYVWPVVQHCHRRRQTLLVERFRTTAPHGRFHEGDVVEIPALADGFSRWPTSLQRQYVELLVWAETEPDRFSQTRASLIHLRARVPITRVEDLAAALASA
ncbi:MAG TPA: hypothetical protein VK034_31330, partial [Enhygromyxa sp.]|nr:hypothetical protein [Enhygromyxa sp.]